MSPHGVSVRTPAGESVVALRDMEGQRKVMQKLSEIGEELLSREQEQRSTVVLVP